MMEQIKQTIEAFIKGRDHRDTVLLEEILQKDYQNGKWQVITNIPSIEPINCM
ncbi:MAG: hypothetical protein MUW56_19275 [Chryseobacterium sp.]|uniref:hypothetical protein n=1 Tax=Chryseobacterium sp. TaxID=1871047 RepID=UPI0025B7B34E|nr:hypothetical protein [Chryseobacterium sp.]MCJ7935704.1 hypothetical protein [Chryseobacterium sp.]